jgi:hypothetical protein
VAFTQPTAGFCTPVATCLYCIAAHRRRAGSVGIVVTNKLLALRARSFAVLNLPCRDQCNGFAVESTVQSSRVTVTVAACAVTAGAIAVAVVMTVAVVAAEVTTAAAVTAVVEMAMVGMVAAEMAVAEMAVAKVAMVALQR